MLEADVSAKVIESQMHPSEPRLPIFAGLNLGAVLVCAGAV